MSNNKNKNKNHNGNNHNNNNHNNKSKKKKDKKPKTELDFLAEKFQQLARVRHMTLPLPQALALAKMFYAERFKEANNYSEFSQGMEIVKKYNDEQMRNRLRSIGLMK